MLDRNSLLEKMKYHFPTWMDIRKRTTSSNGGKLLMAEAKIYADIQDAINEYKKDFFIDSYTGNEDDIVAFIYKYQIGSIDTTKLDVISPMVIVTEDIDTFYINTGYVYYEDGFLYFRTEDIDKLNSLNIQYRYDEFRTSGSVEKMHVWNVFDEFAVFNSLERHLWETNSELTKRILNAWKLPMNSTTSGLKNTIFNELMILDPTLTLEEITIEGQTPENLIKYYKEFGSVVEKLANVNKDLARTKHWDLDTWSYPFKAIDYIPHAWDVALDSYANGIGFENDLKVNLINPKGKTTAHVKFYEQSTTKVQEYFKNKSIAKSISLKLKRYTNVLNPITIKYKITASEVSDITNEGIQLISYKTIDGNDNRYIEDIVAVNGTSDIKVIDKSILPNDGRAYKLIFEPVTDYYSMEIESCKVISYDNNDNMIQEENFLAETLGFKMQNDILVSTATAAYADKTTDFIYSNNAINTSNGIEINDVSKHTILEYDITGMANKPLIAVYDCKMMPLDNSIVEDYGFYLDQNNKWNSDYTGSVNHYMAFGIYANKVSFDVVSAGCTITTIINGVQNISTVSTSTSFSTAVFDTPVNMTIHISSPGTIPVSVSNIKYSRYELKMTTQEGTLIKFDNSYGIPDTGKPNKLIIDMVTFSAFSPYLKYIYIGSSLKNVRYETAPITYENLTRKLVVKSNCNIKLVEFDMLNNVNSTTIDANFEPYKMYEALTDNAYIKLDLSEYFPGASILQPETGAIKIVTTTNDDVAYIQLKYKDQIQKIKIDGERRIAVKKQSLYELLGITQNPDTKVYASGLLKSFIIDNGSTIENKQISYSSIAGLGANMFEFINVPDDNECAFVTINDNNVTIAKEIDKEFSFVYMYSKAASNYIAYNQCKTLKEEIGEVEIVDLFSPFLPINKLMVYKIEPMSTNGDVRFETSNRPFDFLNDWALGKTTIRVKANINIDSSEYYEIETETIEHEATIASNVIELENFYSLPTGETIELSKYIVQAPEVGDIVYKRASALDTPEKNPEFFCSESVMTEEDGFNKLKYSNIDNIKYIGLSPYDPSSVQSNLDSNDYMIMKEEGIIVWKDPSYTTSPKRVFLFYTIAVPDYIQQDLGDLYKMIEYDINAYNEIESFDVEDVTDTSVVSLTTHPKYSRINDPEHPGRVMVKFDSPGFKAELKEDQLIVTNIEQSNTIAVKTGYYYFDSQEYFLFVNQTADTVNQFDKLTMFNVNNEDGVMYLNKKSSNFIKNSFMEKTNMDCIFNVDMTKEDSIKGISTLNSITACDTFNHWVSFGTELSLVPGLNGLGIKFSPTIEKGYAYINITDYLLDDTMLSFFAQGDITAYIGKEIKVNDIKLPKTVAITPVTQIVNKDGNIMSLRFTPDAGYKYYFIVSGLGIVDDIILQSGSSSVNRIHKKNLEYLTLNIEEKVLNDYTCKLFLDREGAIYNGAEMTAEGKIINSSMISWGITLLKEFNDEYSWSRCKIDKMDLDNGILSTIENRTGTIETEPIYVGDVRTIKNFIFKINDVVFGNMAGFQTKILVADTLNGKYRDMLTVKENVGSLKGKYVLPYVKLQITVPGGKVINNIAFYVEYKSTAAAAPAEVPITNGVLISKILDSHYDSNYHLKNINIDSISSLNDVVIQIRGAREDVWTDWKTVLLDSTYKIKNNITFNQYRFFQLKIQLRNKDAYININSIDLEVVK